MSNYDIVIAGNGVASLFLAMKLSEKLRVLVLASGEIKDTASYLAQGGIATVSSNYKDYRDSVKLHIEDTLRASSNTSNKDIVEFILERASELVDELIDIGVPFTKDSSDYDLNLEASHSFRRIFHVEDRTGQSLMEKLYAKLLNYKNLRFINGKFIDAVSINNTYIVRYLADAKINSLHTVKLVIATGGVGGLYKYTSNPSTVDGLGIGIAERLGAELCNMQYVQFHPTYFAGPDAFLISEAVRGEGARLCLEDGKQFMYKYSKDKELATRDIVSRAIYKEMQNNDVDNVFLDLRSVQRATILKKFPYIYRQCKQHGIQLPNDLIPVRPVEHYLCGGVRVDKFSRTSVENLFVVGESACTGLHGANRLASNSLIEALVMAKVLAMYLNDDKYSYSGSFSYQDSLEYDEKLFYYDIVRLRNIMWRYVGIIRSKDGLEKALRFLDELEIGAGKYVKPIVKVAKSIANMAKDKPSVGAHYLED